MNDTEIDLDFRITAAEALAISLRRLNTSD